jgi:flagellar biosynthesis protein FlhG
MSHMMNKTMRIISPMKVIAVTGGKGGIGKSNVAINLACALSTMQQKVMLLDADFGLANVDLLLGLQPQYSLHDVIYNALPLHEVIVQGPFGVSVIPSCRGISEMADLPLAAIQTLIHSIANLADRPNILVIDTAAGIHQSVISLAISASEVLIVLCNDPASIADSYALIKLLNHQFAIRKFRIVTNKVRSIEESQELFAKLTKVTDRFLDVSLYCCGAIPDDRLLEKAVRKNQAVLQAYPSAKSSIEFAQRARTALKWPMPQAIHSGLSFDSYQRIE